MSRDRCALERRLSSKSFCYPLQRLLAVRHTSYIVGYKLGCHKQRKATYRTIARPPPGVVTAMDENHDTPMEEESGTNRGEQPERKASVQESKSAITMVSLPRTSVCVHKVLRSVHVYFLLASQVRTLSQALKPYEHS